MTKAPFVCIDITYHDSEDGHITGLDFTVAYEGGSSTVYMREFPRVPDEQIARVFRQRLVTLGKALQEAGLSSEGVSWAGRQPQ